MAKNKKNGKALKDSETAGAAGGYISYNKEDKKYHVYDNDTDKEIGWSLNRDDASFMDDVYHFGKEEGKKQSMPGNTPTTDPMSGSPET